MVVVVISLSVFVLIQQYFLLSPSFFSSGMLLTFNTLSRRKLKLPFALYVIVRWLRYTPSMIGTLCFMFIAIHQGSGPFFSLEMNEDLVAPCRSNWWRNLLYIHNFDKFDEMVRERMRLMLNNIIVFFSVSPCLLVHSWRNAAAHAGLCPICRLPEKLPFDLSHIRRLHCHWLFQHCQHRLEGLLPALAAQPTLHYQL